MNGSLFLIFSLVSLVVLRLLSMRRQDENRRRSVVEQFEADTGRYLRSIRSGKTVLLPLALRSGIPKDDTAVVCVEALRLNFSTGSERRLRDLDTPIRLANGLYYLGTASPGRRALVPVDAGRLIVTDRRFVFAGEERGISVGFGRVLGVNYRPGEGIEIGRRNGSTLYIEFDLTPLLAARIQATLDAAVAAQAQATRYRPAANAVPAFMD